MMNILSRIQYLLKNNVIYIAIVLLLLGAQSVLVTMLMSVDREDITIGDVFTLTLEITSKPGVTFEPFDPAEYLSAFEIKDFTIDGPRKRFGKQIKIYTYKLSTFISGTYTIPSFEVPYKTPKGKKESIKSSKLSIDVKSVPPHQGEKDDIRDIKPVLRVPVSPWVVVLAVFLIIAAFGIWVFLYIKKKRRILAMQQEFEEQKAPDEIALQRLAELKNLDLIAQGRIKEFYIVLSEIIRRYIERRFNIPVMDKTTFELYKDMRQADVTKRHSTEIKDFLFECDLVKFARYIPENKVIDEDFNRARDVVEQTKKEGLVLDL